jgi:acyl carrier protein
MDDTEILNLIRQRLQDAAAARGAGPIDSLDLAAIVVELEKVTGRDSFRNGFINFCTVGQLA